MKCIQPYQPSSQIIETSEGYQIKLKCELDYYAKKCLTTIIEKHKLTLRIENDLIIIY